MTSSDSGGFTPATSPRRLSGLGMTSGINFDDDEGIDILSLFRSIWHRKVLILLMSALTSLVFFAITMLQERQYTAVATVMLDPREQQVIASQNQVVSDLKLNSPILESEVAILRSTSLLISAVEQIGTDRFAILDPAIEQTSNLFAAGRAEGEGDVAETGGSVEISTGMASGLSPEERHMNRIVRELRKGMSIRRIGDSYVIEISVSTIDPDLSAAVANALANGYIERQLQDRRRVAESATRWLAEQVEQRRVDVVEAETAVETFKKAQIDQFYLTDEMLDLQMSELNQQLAEARAERTTEQARLQQIETILNERGALVAAETQQSTLILTMRAARSELQQEDSRLAETVGPQHPQRRTIANEIAEVERAIAQEVRNIAEAYRNEISVLRIREAALQEEVDAIQSKLSGNATATLQLRQMEREADAARQTYEDLLTRLGETRAQTEIQRAEARLVNSAQVPGGPSSPRVKLLTAFGATLGLTAGLVAALALEMVSSGFISSSDVERITGLPVLATIPKEKIRWPASVLEKLNDQSFSLYSERIRQLRTVLEMGKTVGGAHVMVILSSVPNEGKTTTALALARSYAMSGKKTLLLDLDTRRSALFRELGDANVGDLGDYLAGNAALDDIILADDRLGFSIVGSNRYTALLADSVSTSVLEDVFAVLRDRFEVIVVDAPPVLAVSDGLNIASISDSILYLIRHRKTSRKSVSYGLSSLRHVKLRPTGVVLTMAEVGSDPENYAAEYTYQ